LMSESCPIVAAVGTPLRAQGPTLSPIKLRTRSGGPRSTTSLGAPIHHLFALHDNAEHRLTFLAPRWLVEFTEDLFGSLDVLLRLPSMILNRALELRSLGRFRHFGQRLQNLLLHTAYLSANAARRSFMVFVTRSHLLGCWNPTRRRRVSSSDL